MTEKKPLITLIISGGVLQDVICDTPDCQVRVMAIDYDCDGDDEADLTKVKYVDGWGSARARVWAPDVIGPNDHVISNLEELWGQVTT